MNITYVRKSADLFEEIIVKTAIFRYKKSNGEKEDVEFILLDIPKIRESLANQTTSIHKKYMLLELWEEYQENLEAFIDAAMDYIASVNRYNKATRAYNELTLTTDPQEVVMRDVGIFKRQYNQSKLLQDARKMGIFLQQNPKDDYDMPDKTPIKKS
ncbi:hypothetical protein ACTFR8_23225 [Bacillus cereus group sp. MYBK15-3]|uniref:hypothetical protein n=1 Tax=Bacillus cereus group TaxID=86661 RepID=UPI001C8C36AB|nr:hypothetical protein [Bacillus cereus]MBX9158512.1 hypothetical protein [Bacillus cereus]